MKLVPNSVTRKLAKEILVAKRNSPHIFFAAGVVGVIGSAVLACRSTLKLEETVDEIKEDLDSVKALGVAGNRAITYNDREYVKDLTFVYAKSGAKLARLYGPSIVLGGLSIASLTGSHVQLVRRNTALASTLAVVTKAFDEYRVRVQDEIGEERELDLYRGVREETHTIDGKKEIVKVQTGAGNLSPYARCFDATSPYWKKDPEMNLFFLKCQQNWLNDQLQANGFVFLNDVYDQLGFEKTSAGQMVGWIRRKDGGVDGYVDFGLYEAHTLAFLSGHDPDIWLDFNVDGLIQDLIDKI